VTFTIYWFNLDVADMDVLIKPPLAGSRWLVSKLRLIFTVLMEAIVPGAL
jgi:hypothetical protein